MVAISRIEVHHDGYGGTAPDAMVWDRGGLVKPRASSLRIIVDHATLPGPPGFLDSTWCTLYPIPITREDFAVSPYSVNILLEVSSFLASLHWLQGDTDLGKFGISYFELLLMFEISVGHRLHAEKAVRPHLRPRRPLVFSGVPVGIGQEIRHGCQFHHSLFRALGHLPGGLVRFSSSTPFSKTFPSWPVPDLSGRYPVVGSGPGPSFHFLDRDPVRERPAKRFRITGKSSAVTRAQVSFGDLPTPKRWKRLVPQGTSLIGDEDGPPLFLFPRIGVG